MMNLDDYIEHLKHLSEEYQWPLKQYEKNLDKREKVHEKFPYVVTYPGLYCPGGMLDVMNDWCRENYGDRDGECYWRKCEMGFDRWYEYTGLEEELEKLLSGVSNEEADEIIDSHFKRIESRPDVPKEHSHEGIWTSFFVVKTGYDYGYEDFCFKNKEDALHFKLIWDDEIERRK